MEKDNVMCQLVLAGRVLSLIAASCERANITDANYTYFLP